MSQPRNLLHQWSRLLIESLIDAGVRDVVMSPGSRSTPLVLAIAEATARGALRCHPIVDERAAGFHALGMAKATGVPALLLCTSGTAGAHYLPAVIEAGASYSPLLLLTADRPFELQGCAAPQTIDQVKLFGDHARAWFDCGMPDASEGALRALRRLAAQAVATSLTPVPGAVHLNLRARKPLEPPPASELDGVERALASDVRQLAARPIARHFAPRLVPPARAIDELATACRSATRGVILAGPAPMSQVEARHAIFSVARQSGFPLLAEAASQLRFTPPGAREGVVVCDRYDALLAVPAFRDAATPDLVIQIGAPPTSAAIEAWLSAHPDCPKWVIAPHGWNDPSSRATGLIRAGVSEAFGALSTELEGRGPPTPGGPHGPWQLHFSDGAKAAMVASSEVVDEARFDEAVATVIAAAHPASTLGAAPVLALGNSLPIRMVDLFCDGELTDSTVWSQRGASGIDGLIAGAAGVARSGRPTRLLIGDVSALHDLGGLAAARDLAVPFVVVVMNNGGGRIFEQLPVAARPDLASALPLFTTPQQQSFEAAAAFFGLRYVAVEEAGAMRSALARAGQTVGCTILEARVPPSSARDATLALRARLAELLLARPALPPHPAEGDCG